MILARINEEEELMLKKYRSERYRQLVEELASREGVEDIIHAEPHNPYETEVNFIEDRRPADEHISDKQSIEYAVKHMEFYLLNIRKIFETTDVQTSNQKLLEGWELLHIYIHDNMKIEVLYILGLRDCSLTLGDFVCKNCKDSVQVKDKDQKDGGTYE